jgi:hypothetical protein
MCPEGPEAYQFMSPCHTRPAPLGYPFVPLVEEWFPHKLPAWPEGMKKRTGAALRGSSPLLCVLNITRKRLCVG